MINNKRTFIRIADDIINLDFVTHVEIKAKNEAKIYFDYLNEQGKPAALELPQEYAEQVLETLKPFIIGNAD
jgi:hypothetical protein